MVSVKEFLFMSFFYHCSVRCIDFFVSREYMGRSTCSNKPLAQMGKRLFNVKKMLVFKVIITFGSHSQT